MLHPAEVPAAPNFGPCPLKSHLALGISLISKKPYKTTVFSESFERIRTLPPELSSTDLASAAFAAWAQVGVSLMQRKQHCAAVLNLGALISSDYMAPPSTGFAWLVAKQDCPSAILAPSSASRTRAFTLTCLKMSQAQAITPKMRLKIQWEMLR